MEASIPVFFEDSSFSHSSGVFCCLLYAWYLLSIGGSHEQGLVPLSWRSSGESLLFGKPFSLWSELAQGRLLGGGAPFPANYPLAPAGKHLES